jgi:predicted nucleic acid-binding protein
MITAVDTNVLIDIFKTDPAFGSQSAALLRRCMTEGRLVACEVVWSELTAMFPSKDALDKNMRLLRVEFLPLTREASHIAGMHWKQYLKRGGKRTRLLTDFLVASHAQVQCDQLLTRDQGFYRDYFDELVVVDPTD